MPTPTGGYKIIRSNDPIDLAEKVNAALTNSPSALGAPILAPNGIWYQAIGPASASGGGGSSIADGAPIDILSSVATLAGIASVDAGVLQGVVMPQDYTPVKDAAVLSLKTANVASNLYNATASVSTNQLQDLVLESDATILKSADTIAIQNSAGTAIDNATLTVAGGVVTAAELPATVAAVANGAALAVPVTGAYTDTVTFTVAAGVITGIALS